VPGTQLSRQIGGVTAFAIATLVTLVVVIAGVVQHYQPRMIVAAAIALFYLLLGDFLPAARGVSDRIRRVLPSQITWLVAVPLLACWFIYAFGTGTFTAKNAAIACGYVLLPLALLSLRNASMAPGVPEYLAWISIALPLKTKWLQNLWPWPSQVGYSFGILLLINVAVVGFLFTKRLDGVGYSVGWSKGWTLIVLGSFAAIAAIVIPLGFSLHFLRWNPLSRGWKRTSPAAIGILLFTAWPEELLFRGVLQNMLQKTMRSDWGGWITASVAFGLAHITNGGFPNWRYVLLASIAGFVYGFAWRKTGSIFGSALVHTMVDFFWLALFR
jgi:uncharacterized protein